MKVHVNWFCLMHLLTCISHELSDKNCLIEDLYCFMYNTLQYMMEMSIDKILVTYTC